MPLWWFVTWSTYGWWLPGDPRGFQTRRGREYVPPPARYAGPSERPYDAAQYRGRWRYARRLCPEAVRLTPEEQQLALDAVVNDIGQLQVAPRILGFGATHVHLVAKFGLLKIRPTVGRWKSHATRALPNPGTRRRVWAEGCHMKSLTDEEAFNNAVNYVRDHVNEGALIHEWQV